MWNDPVPPIEQNSYRLDGGVMIERPLDLALDDLKACLLVDYHTAEGCALLVRSDDLGGFQFDGPGEDVKPLAATTAARIDCPDKRYESVSLEGMSGPGVMLCLGMERKSTLLILPGLGGARDQDTAKGFPNHSRGEPCGRNVWMLAPGSGLEEGETDRPISHVDVATTAGGHSRGSQRQSAGPPNTRSGRLNGHTLMAVARAGRRPVLAAPESGTFRVCAKATKG